ncbi:MAG: hypothetical protein GY777_28465 [Candidatus Brocadiaceae bacterium]|nr:hypothetical protein [Candidatus Brocadiaceae bacterium]
MNARVLGRGAELVGVNGENWELRQLLFADDTVLVADSEEKLRRLVTEFGRVCDRRKLRVNVGKSKVMKVVRNVDNADMGMDVSLGEERLEEVECFKYLESNMDKSEGCGGGSVPASE